LFKCKLDWTSMHGHLFRFKYFLRGWHRNSWCFHYNFGKQTGASYLAGGRNNAFYGYQTGNDNTTGDDNAYFGTQAGFQNVTGSRNNLFGRLAGEKNKSSDNSFFGHLSDRDNTDGTRNSFLGSFSGQANLGDYNSFFGHAAGDSTTTGDENSFLDPILARILRLVTGNLFFDFLRVVSILQG
jgi:hypothetical protein